ncbi:Argininosuccinate lyase, partial [Tetrabaena socialis]
MAPLALHQRSLGSIKEAAAHSRGCRSQVPARARVAVMAQATSAPAAPAAEPKKLWGGRFTGKTDPLMEKFNESLPFDKRLWAEDIRRVGQKHGRALLPVGVARFTHLQNAMTVRWSHWLMCHCSAWQRDDMRLRDLAPRVAMLPLGSGERPSQLLQRGKGGRMQGNLMGVMAVLKGTPTTYNKDLQRSRFAPAPNCGVGSPADAPSLVRTASAGQRSQQTVPSHRAPRLCPRPQECWELLFDTVDTVHDVVRIATGVLSTIKIKPDRMLS